MPVVEQWKCVATLRGHSGGSFGIRVEIYIFIVRSTLPSLDVLDLAWSQGDIWLASCSVDNLIIIWNGQRFPGNNNKHTAELFIPLVL